MTERIAAPRAQGRPAPDIRAVIFDIDGVLLDSKPANYAYYRSLLERHDFPPVSDAELDYGHSHTLRESIAYLTRAPEHVVDELFERSRDLAGYPYDLVTLPEGCIEALESLGRSYRLAVMSSRINEGIQQYLDLTGTHDYFGTVVGYEDSEHHKPHAEPLLVACERLGVEPSAAVYVGDAASDMACAQAAGAHFIAFGDAIPDAEPVISCFDELEATIRRLCS